MQTGFFQGVVIPLYAQIAAIFPGANQVLQQATRNSDHWIKARAAAEEAQKQAADSKKQAAADH
jgi:hypothetical protein